MNEKSNSTCNLKPAHEANFNHFSLKFNYKYVDLFEF